MKRSIAVGLLTFLAIGCSTNLPTSSTQSPAPVAIAAKPAANSSTVQSRDVFYLSDRFGFRFVSPRGYVITPTETTQSTKPSPPLEVLEVWQQKDFLNRENLPETPPIVSITIYDNSKRLPLTSWKGELSQNDDRPLTVAGQKAIAYTSTGLYESDNVLFSSPDGRYVFRLQGAYLQKNDSIRQVYQDTVKSFTFDAIASTSPNKWRINYSRLKSLLAAGDWRGADVETRAIFQRLQKLQGQGADLLYGSKTLLNSLPCEDFRTIDTLWLQASKGRFGYSAQKRIWQQTASQTKNPKARVEKFGQAVGWYRSQPLPEKNPFGVVLAGTKWRLDSELNSTATAPIGQFPWAGISSNLLSDMLSEPGCGSCTTDAIYLASDRYYDYVPALFTKLNQCQVR
ncbi:GUN4 domain-containing protein [Trichocoleus sp. DQ-U1]|uniref:GUN4 domain-containing protein n=1 Tax=Trichocoleus sp. DQ-U1 TaxID=2933926 RepID=UPI003299F6DB